MRRSSQGWVLGAVGLALAAGLTACDADDSPRPATSTRSASNPASPTTTATRSTATPPPTTRTVAVPPEATKHSEAGAKAFAKFYVTEADEALVSADSSTVRAISTPSCKGCKVFIDWADELKDQGRHHANRAFAVSGQLVRPDSTESRYVIDVLIDEAEVDVLDLGGAKVRSEPAQRATLRTTLDWSASRWSVAESLLVKN